MGTKIPTDQQRKHVREAVTSIQEAAFALAKAFGKHPTEAQFSEFDALAEIAQRLAAAAEAEAWPE